VKLKITNVRDSYLQKMSNESLLLFINSDKMRSQNMILLWL